MYPPVHNNGTEKIGFLHYLVEKTGQFYYNLNGPTKI